MDWHWRHSKFQIENFIIKLNGVTPWGMFKQCMRELRARGDRLDDWDVRREFNILFTIASNLYVTIGPLTPQRMESLEEDFWFNKFVLQAALEIASLGSVNISTLESIINMPQKNEIFELINRFDRDKALLYLQNVRPSWDRILPPDSEIFELKEGDNWQKMILGVFGIEAQTIPE